MIINSLVHPTAISNNNKPAFSGIAKFPQGEKVFNEIANQARKEAKDNPMAEEIIKLLNERIKYIVKKTETTLAKRLDSAITLENQGDGVYHLTHSIERNDKLTEPIVESFFKLNLNELNPAKKESERYFVSKKDSLMGGRYSTVSPKGIRANMFDTNYVYKLILADEKRAAKEAGKQELLVTPEKGTIVGKIIKKLIG